jgi:hypothetical protein
MRSMKTAYLALRHRPNPHSKQRIVMFIGSPLDWLEAEYQPGDVRFSHFCDFLQLIFEFLIYILQFIAAEAGQEVQEGEDLCGFCSLWRGGHRREKPSLCCEML